MFKPLLSSQVSSSWGRCSSQQPAPGRQSRLTRTRNTGATGNQAWKEVAGRRGCPAAFTAQTLTAVPLSNTRRDGGETLPGLHACLAFKENWSQRIGVSMRSVRMLNALAQLAISSAEKQKLKVRPPYVPGILSQADQWKPSVSRQSWLKPNPWLKSV